MKLHFAALFAPLALLYACPASAETPRSVVAAPKSEQHTRIHDSGAAHRTSIAPAAR